jgi:arginyl-tRNA synthetase
MVFAVARAAGWLPEGVRAEHVAFGSILGEDRKMFRSRSGDSVKLAALLDEAVERAGAALGERAAGLEPAERDRVARDLGIGAVKYADLSTDRSRDYVFDWDRMLSFEGDTGPYLTYAHARIRSIFRRLGTDGADTTARVVLAEPQERALALELLRFPEALDTTLEWYAPHRLAGYLFGLAQAFTSFYEACPVLRAPDDAVRQSRLVLCDATARTLALGLSFLGIAAPERM